MESRQTNTANEIEHITPQGGTATDLLHDDAGNMIDDGSNFAYTYDAWNRLAQVNVRGEGGHLVALYRYDGQGYRVSKAVPVYTGESITGYNRTDYYYNTDWQVMEERYSANQGASDAVATTAVYQYAWEPRYIDSPEVRFTLSSLGGPTGTYYYLTDANMNVTALVRGSTGAVAERYVYDSYGNFRVTSTDCQDRVNAELQNQDRVNAELRNFSTHKLGAFHD